MHVRVELTILLFVNVQMDEANDKVVPKQPCSQRLLCRICLPVITYHSYKKTFVIFNFSITHSFVVCSGMFFFVCVSCLFATYVYANRIITFINAIVLTQLLSC